MAIATQLENGCWWVNWSFANRIDQTIFNCEKSTFQLDAVFNLRTYDIVFTMKMSPETRMFFLCFSSNCSLF